MNVLIFLKLFHKTEREEKIPNSSYKVHIILIAIPDQNTHTKKEDISFSKKHRSKNSSKKIFTNQIQELINHITHGQPWWCTSLIPVLRRQK